MNYNPCSIYVIIKCNSPLHGHEKGAARGNSCKIGISDDIEKRFVQLNCHPEKLEIVAEYEVESRKYALQIEKIIHNFLQHKRLGKEWFYLTYDELKIVDDMIVAFFDVSVHYYEKQHLTYNQSRSITEKLSDSVILDDIYFVKNYELETKNVEEKISFQKRKEFTPTDLSKESHWKILKDVFKKEKKLKYAEIAKQIRFAVEKNNKKIGENKAKIFLQYYKNKELIIEMGDAHSKNKYRNY